MLCCVYVLVLVDMCICMWQAALQDMNTRCIQAGKVCSSVVVWFITDGAETVYNDAMVCIFEEKVKDRL